MQRLLPLIAIAMGMYASPVHAADSCMAVIPPEAAAKGKAFFDLLVAGKGSEAVAGVVDSSLLWSQRTGVKEQMTGQIDAATKAYGPPAKWEPVCGDATGTMVFREYYLVQHRETVTRWELDFARTSAGWKIAYFGFSDQVQTFF